MVSKYELACIKLALYFRVKLVVVVDVAEMTGINGIAGVTVQAKGIFTPNGVVTR